MSGDRYLRQINTGHIYAWAPELEDRPDMEPFEFPEPEPEPEKPPEPDKAAHKRETKP
ncbi:MAG TPA: hypothetical protein PLY77_10670 [Plasticicumulans sp.]|nr:hypothetical protein [Plasticicumulans sp.]HNJ08407.1 hypothetical protein [Plasticicumulans sp.]